MYILNAVDFKESFIQLKTNQFKFMNNCYLFH